MAQYLNIYSRNKFYYKAINNNTFRVPWATTRNDQNICRADNSLIRADKILK